jgi:hypothetical protein
MQKIWFKIRKVELWISLGKLYAIHTISIVWYNMRVLTYQNPNESSHKGLIVLVLKEQKDLAFKWSLYSNFTAQIRVLGTPPESIDARLSFCKKTYLCLSEYPLYYFQRLIKSCIKQYNARHIVHNSLKLRTIYFIPTFRS